MKLKKFISELKRRNVYKVLLAYGLAAWLIAQISGLVLDSFEAPTWIMKMIIIILMIGFPIAIILTWIFEFSPQGLVKTEALTSETSHQQKNITSKIIISIIALIFFIFVGWWSWQEFIIDDTKPIQSIAILPFDSFSLDDNQQVIASGLQDNLITSVSKISALRVTPRPSTMRYKNTEMNSTQIAKELNVDAIIEASVMKFGDTIRINIQLIGLYPEEKHIWTQTFERPTEDVYSLFNDVTQSLAHEINLVLSSNEKERLSNSYKVHPDAYKAYLNGRFYWDLLTDNSLQKALDYYELAIKIDSNFAPAYAGIAATWSGRRQMRMAPNKEAEKASLEAIEKAFALDSLDPEVLYNYAISAGWIAWDWEKTRHAYEKTLELNPSHANAHAYYSNFLIAMGENEKAMIHIRKALELDPYNDLIQGLYVINLSFLEQCEEVFSLNETNEFTHGLAIRSLSNCYFLEGMDDKMFEFKINMWQNDSINRPLIQRAFDQGGISMAIKKELEILVERSKYAEISLFGLAIRYAQLQDKENTLIWLEKAFLQRDAGIPYMNAVPIFDFVRKEPQFKAILKKMKLPSS